MLSRVRLVMYVSVASNAGALLHHFIRGLPFSIPAKLISGVALTAVLGIPFQAKLSRLGPGGGGGGGGGGGDIRKRQRLS